MKNKASTFDGTAAPSVAGRRRSLVEVTAGTNARGWRAAAAALVLAAVAWTAAATEVPWRPEPVERVYEQKDLRELIRELAASQSITANVDNEVTGTVYGKFKLPPRTLFEYLVSTYGLIYYYAGNVLYVYPASAAVSEVVQLKRADAGALIRTLTEMGINDRRYPVSINRRERTLIVSGPKNYVDIVKQVARSVDENEGGRTVTTVVRLFPLQYAWARDYTFREGGRQVQVPGVATTLQKLFPAVNRAPSQRVSTRVGPALAQEPVNRKLRNSDLTLRLPPKMPGADEWAQPQDGGDDGGEISGGGGAYPQFVADGRMNAVLIRDVPDRMPGYEDLIRQLDVRPLLVEIEATVIEIGSDELSSLGIDWRFTGAKYDLRSGRDLPNQRWPTSGLPTAPGVVDTGPFGAAATSAGAVLTTILTDGGRQFVARLNALARDGKANFRAAPKVLTLDNSEASLERLRTFFVRIPGTYNNDLFDVSVGTSMRVTPLVVNEAGGMRIKLSVRIDDGEVTDQRVDEIPVVRRNSIGTQALVGNGESLLLAGYTEEVKREVESGVPGLSKIPLIGYLFKQKDTVGERVERLFMITPRLVSPTPPQ